MPDDRHLMGRLGLNLEHTLQRKRRAQRQHTALNLSHLGAVVDSTAPRGTVAIPYSRASLSYCPGPGPTTRCFGRTPMKRFSCAEEGDGTLKMTSVSNPYRQCASYHGKAHFVQQGLRALVTKTLFPMR